MNTEIIFKFQFILRYKFNKDKCILCTENCIILQNVKAKLNREKDITIFMGCEINIAKMSILCKLIYGMDPTQSQLEFEQTFYRYRIKYIEKDDSKIYMKRQRT